MNRGGRRANTAPRADGGTVSVPIVYARAVSLSPKHELHARPIPAHPYRTTAILHGVLAAVVLAVTLITGGALARGALIAGAYFVAATGWAWWRFKVRIDAERRTAAARANRPPQGE